MPRFKKDTKKVPKEPKERSQVRVTDVDLNTVTQPAIPLSELADRDEEYQESPEEGEEQEEKKFFRRKPVERTLTGVSELKFFCW